MVTESFNIGDMVRSNNHKKLCTGNVLLKMEVKSNKNKYILIEIDQIDRNNYSGFYLDRSISIVGYNVISYDKEKIFLSEDKRSILYTERSKNIRAMWIEPKDCELSIKPYDPSQQPVDEEDI